MTKLTKIAIFRRQQAKQIKNNNVPIKHCTTRAVDDDSGNGKTALTGAVCLEKNRHQAECKAIKKCSNDDADQNFKTALIKQKLSGTRREKNKKQNKTRKQKQNRNKTKQA